MRALALAIVLAASSSSAIAPGARDPAALAGAIAAAFAASIKHF